MLTRCWDVYPKEGRSDYAIVNPHNFCPIFAQDQLTESLQAMHITVPHSSTPVVYIYHTAALDIVKLYDDICAMLLRDPAILPLLPKNLVQIPVASAKKSVPFISLPYTYDSDGYIHLDGHIYVLSEGDLHNTSHMVS
jgi:hypothetical protein